MLDALSLLFVAVLGPFVTAAATPLAARWLGDRVGYLAAAAAAVSLGAVALLWTGGAPMAGVHGVTWFDAPGLGYGVSLSFLVDGLSLLMAGLVAAVGVLVMVYGRGYMAGEDHVGRFFAYLLAFMGAMMGLVLANDLIALFVFWELTSLTSFLLIGFHRDRPLSVLAARKSLLITVAGGLAMLAGVVLLGRIADTFSIAALIAAPPSGDPLTWTALALIGVGVATKSAQVPFHVWLPDAMEAPTPVSAFLHSATMVKAGVYLLARLAPILDGLAPWTPLFAALGLLTMLVGAALAVAADDAKALLAYSTVSHLGLIAAAFGFAGDAGAEAGVFHLLNHAAFKAALFMVAGVAAHRVGSRKLDDLGGLRDGAPWAAAAAVVAALSMAAIPPFAGFLSKEYVFEAIWHAAEASVWGWLAVATAVVASMLTVAYSWRFVDAVVRGEETPVGRDRGVDDVDADTDAVDHGPEIHPTPIASVAPAVVLAGVVGLVTLAPDAIGGAATRAAVDAVAGESLGFHPHLPTSVTPPLAMSAVALVGGVALATRHRSVSMRLRRSLRRHPRATADGLYDAATSVAPRLGRSAARTVDGGSLRAYMTALIGGAAALALAGFVVGAPPIDTAITTAPATLPLVGILLLTVAASLAVPFARSHVEGVLMLSIVGFMVGIFYVLAAAPDLAMTQIVVETITLVVFMLVLERLPAFYVEEVGRLARGRDAAVAVAVAATVFVAMLAARSSPSPGIGRALLEQSVPEGGGHNVVNVILVDFRALDTLGEIAVVGMAGAGVVALLASRTGAGGDESP